MSEQVWAEWTAASEALTGDGQCAAEDQLAKLHAFATAELKLLKLSAVRNMAQEEEAGVFLHRIEQAIAGASNDDD